jgi:hypothetical protein
LNYKPNRKGEVLALLFGLLMVLEIFGDRVMVQGVEVAGNLDTIFGHALWPFLDMFYPLASIVVFLLYGQTNGRIQFNLRSILIFLAFLAAIIIMQFDDFFVVFRYSITLPDLYWTIARVVYLFTAAGTFFAFGLTSSRKVKEAPNIEKL